MMYVIPSRVVKVEKKNIGWFILMEGSSEWLYVGEEQPGLVAGDEVEITIRKRKA